jgi:hypothetical protein
MREIRQSGSEGGGTFVLPTPIGKERLAPFTQLQLATHFRAYLRSLQAGMPALPGSAPRYNS